MKLLTFNYKGASFANEKYFINAVFKDHKTRHLFARNNIKTIIQAVNKILDISEEQIKKVVMKAEKRC